MAELEIVDLLCFLTLLIAVFLLSRSFLRPPRFSASIQGWVSMGGALWLIYALLSEHFTNWVLGVPWMDARAHAAIGMRMANAIQQYGWSDYFESFKVGNQAYQRYCALVYLAGGSIHTLTLVNGFLGFWGGLILVRSLSRFEVLPVLRNWLVVLVVFCPSVVYWCTVNLKEAPMYWAICSVFAQTFPSGDVRERIGGWALFVAGAVVGLLFRPIVMVGWLLSVAGATLLKRGFRAKSAVILLALPLIVSVVMASLGGTVSTETALDYAETRMQNLAHIETGSEIEYTFGQPIFMVSGIMTVFFLPLPWQVSSLRVLLAFVETWGMTLLIVYAWFHVSRRLLPVAYRIPALLVAVSATAWMCALLTYYPNLGLVARQRVQVIPALLALAIIPLALQRGVQIRLAVSQWLQVRKVHAPVTDPGSAASDAALPKHGKDQRRCTPDV